MTTQQQIKLGSAVATGLDAILVYADTVKQIPSIPGWLVHSWPFIFLAIVAIDRGLHAYLGDAPPAQLNKTPPK